MSKRCSCDLDMKDGRTTCPMHGYSQTRQEWEEEFDLLWAKDDEPRLRKFALEFLQKTLASHRKTLLREVEGIINLLGNTQIELHHGKLPFVIYPNRVNDEDVVLIYRQALADFAKHLARLAPPTEQDLQA